MLREILDKLMFWRRELTDEELGELTLKEYLKVLKSNGDAESLQLADEMEQIAVKLALYEANTNGKTLSLDEIEQMRWKEVKFKVRMWLENYKMQIQTINEMIGLHEGATGIGERDLKFLGNNWDGLILRK